jgi:hypothetical protein
MSESDLMRSVMLAVSREGHRVFRHNVAEGWMGDAQVTHHAGGISVYIPHARPLHAGLVVGGSDLIGYSKDGRFLAIETKAKRGRLTKEQQNFLTQVNAAGGIGIMARSVEEALSALTKPTM